MRGSEVVGEPPSLEVALLSRQDAIMTGDRTIESLCASDLRIAPRCEESSGKQRLLDANKAWLEERWRMAEAEKRAGTLKLFPGWFFDPPTDRQRERLARDGVRFSGDATKGQLSESSGSSSNRRRRSSSASSTTASALPAQRVIRRAHDSRSGSSPPIRRRSAP